jgi:hypothetical protein
MAPPIATAWADAADERLRDRWSDIFRRDTLVHLGLMASIVAATFQGYLKDRIAGALPYALADGFLMGAAALWFGQMAVRHAPFRGPGRSTSLLLVVTLVPTLYLLHPGTPALIKLAGLRAWIEFPVACLMALSVIRTTGQVRAYLGLILALCAVTAAYGIWQYRAGPEAVLSVGNLAELRHGGTVFYILPGTAQLRFRAISTFTFPAPFAMMMVFGILLAAGVLASRLKRAGVRFVLLLLIPVMFLGMTYSGTRAAMIILAAGIGVIAWYRRLTAGQVVLAMALLLAMYLASITTAGTAITRFQSAFLQEGLLWVYLLGPVTVAARALGESLVGLGLGRTGVGVPFALSQAQGTDYFIFSDGDVGRAAVEMGLVGIVLVLVIVLGFLPLAWRAARALLGTDSEDVGLGIVALLTATGLGVLIGSPFASAPHGTMWWFLLGALLKLGMMAEEERQRVPDDAETGEEGREKREA